MGYVLLAAAVVVAAGVLHQVYDLRHRLGRSEILLRESREALERLRAQVEKDVFALKCTLDQRAGKTIFTPETPVRDALRFHPKAERLFAKHRPAGIIRIDWEGSETIGEACRMYGIDQEALLRDLNALR